MPSKIGQKTIDAGHAGQAEIKQLLGLIEKAFYPKRNSSEDEEEQVWDEVEETEVSILLDNVGGGVGISGENQVTAELLNDDGAVVENGEEKQPQHGPKEHNFVLKFLKGNVDAAQKMILHGVGTVEKVIGKLQEKKIKQEEEEENRHIEVTHNSI